MNRDYKVHDIFNIWEETKSNYSIYQLNLKKLMFLEGSK